MLKQSRPYILLALFGVLFPWPWVGFIGIWAAVIEFPMLTRINATVGPVSQTFATYFILANSITAALVIAAVVSWPLGYFLKRPVFKAWGVFATSFVACLLVGAVMEEETMALLDLMFGSAELWAFLAMSALFWRWGSALRVRRQKAQQFVGADRPSGAAAQLQR